MFHCCSYLENVLLLRSSIQNRNSFRSKTSFQMSLAFSLEMLTLLWRTVYFAAIKMQSLFDIQWAQRKGVKTV